MQSSPNPHVLDPAGIKDSTAAIQYMINNQKSINLAPGKYRLTESLILSEEIRLDLGKAILFRDDAKDSSGFINNVDMNHRCNYTLHTSKCGNWYSHKHGRVFDMLIIQGDGVEVIGGTIDGRMGDPLCTTNSSLIPAHPESCFSGIMIKGDRVVIRGVTIIGTVSNEYVKNGQSRGAITLDNCKHVSIRKCVVKNNNATGVYVIGSRNEFCEIIDCELSYNGPHIGSGISGRGYSRLKVMGNTCVDNVYTNISVNGKYSRIIDNYSKGASRGYAGITIGHNNPESCAEGTICRGNTIEENGKVLRGFPILIVSKKKDHQPGTGLMISNSDKVQIVGNTIRQNNGPGIRFLGKKGFPDPRYEHKQGRPHCIVAFNIIEHNSQSKCKPGCLECKKIRCGGIELEWGSHSIRGNLIQYNSSNGILINKTAATGRSTYVTPMQIIKIEGNEIRGNGGQYNAGINVLVNDDPKTSPWVISLNRQGMDEYASWHQYRFIINPGIFANPNNMEVDRPPDSPCPLNNLTWIDVL